MACLFSYMGDGFARRGRLAGLFMFGRAFCDWCLSRRLTSTSSEPVNFCALFPLQSFIKSTMISSTEARVRLRKPDRAQVTMRVECDDDLIPEGHSARTIWSVIEKLDLRAFHEPIKARDGVCGRDATDPRLLVSLWLYAATRGVGSARELARLCVESRPYRWLCGGVTLNHHSLSDFRVGHAAALDELFTQVLAALVQQGLVKVRRISQDGTRVRAGAGASSFRRGPRLEALLEQAGRHVAELRSLLDDPEKSAGLSAKKKAARTRAAAGRQKRIEAALEVLPKLAAQQQAALKQAGNGKYAQEYQPKPSDTTAQAQWRQRMAGEEAKTIYKERAATSETVNADLKQHRGLVQLTVRGLAKAQCVAIWCALAYNLMHFGAALLR